MYRKTRKLFIINNNWVDLFFYIQILVALEFLFAYVSMHIDCEKYLSRR